MLRLARRYRFCASHRLHVSALSEAENRELFGKCNNPFGHGHDYVLEVVVRGVPDPRTGLLAPVAVLDQFVRDRVLVHYDHRYLNEQLDCFSDVPPTTENVAVDIRGRLKDAWPFGEQPALDGIRIFETRRNIVEIS